MNSKQIPVKARRRFCAAAMPPVKPDMPFFSYEPTHIELELKQDVLASAMGDALLRVLEGEAEASKEVIAVYTVKDTAGKFSVKAAVCLGDHHCRLKVKFYAAPSGLGTYVMEFRHLSGDERTFQDVYGMAARFLNGLEDFVVTPSVLPTEHEGWKIQRSAQHIGPLAEAIALFDTAGFCEAHDLQLAGALALARAAKDPDTAAKLCSDRIFEGVRMLLRSGSAEVQWPVARCLMKLHTVCAIAAPIATLRDSLEEQLDAEATCPLVKEMFQELLAAERATLPPSLSPKCCVDLTGFNSLVEPDIALRMEHHRPQ